MVSPELKDAPGQSCLRQIRRGGQGGRLREALRCSHQIGVKWVGQHSPQLSGVAGSGQKRACLTGYIPGEGSKCRSGQRVRIETRQNRGSQNPHEYWILYLHAPLATFGRIGGRPKDSEKERPEGLFWAGKRGEKGVSRPKVCEAERADNEAMTRQNPPLGQAGFEPQRTFR